VLDLVADGFSAMWSRSAIWRLVRPRHISRNTSTSRWHEERTAVGS
jgi:hypothetical protein